MTNEIPDVDTYEILEFQGFVADVPTYDRKLKRLDFVARALNRPTLRFFAQGEVAKGFKSLLHKGCLIQARAVPKPKIEIVGGERCRVIEWEAKEMALLGRRTVNLGAFSDIRILDGLMPQEDEYRDVGYIDPISYGRFQEYLDSAEEETKRRRELEGKDG